LPEKDFDAVELAKKIVPEHAAVLPTMEMPLRRILEKWFDAIHARPTVVAEVEDAALVNHFGAEGFGFIPVYSAVLAEVTTMYGFQKLGVVKGAEIEL
jgi:hypothetical protein